MILGDEEWSDPIEDELEKLAHCTEMAALGATVVALERAIMHKAKKCDCPNTLRSIIQMRMAQYNLTAEDMGENFTKILSPAP